MKVTVEGIVLSETNYSETSKILNILTKEYGQVSVIAKGARGIKSHLRGVSMKLVYANFTFTYKEQGLGTLTEGSIINSLKNILNDFKKMSYANYLVNLTRNVLKENNNGLLFLYLKQSLLKINEGFEPSLITNIYEMKLLDFLGVRPDFETCIACGNSKTLTFDISLGGMVCSNCYQNTYTFLPNTIKLLRLFQIVDIEKIDKLKITSSKVVEEINLFIKEYYDTYTGLYVKKLDLIPNIFLGIDKK